MTDTDLDVIESAVEAIMVAFDVDQPPVPIELMLERPREGLWERADLAELTSSFLLITERFGPRMSVARLLARHISRSDWGKQNGLDSIVTSQTLTNQFARSLAMPRRMLKSALESGQSEIAILNRFEVPEKDYHQRRVELGF